MVVDDILNAAEGNDIEFDGYDYDRDSEKTLMVPDRFGDYLCKLSCRQD